jgi:glycosyltransferase involved in cell wall biosynthesis
MVINMVPDNTQDAVKISAYLITLNEEAHLEEVLASLVEADEIILVDSGSTDRTLEIAAQYGARIINQPWLGFAKQKAFALSQCQYAWALNLDGDEVLPQGAIATIKETLKKAPHFCYAFHRDDYFMGASMRFAKMKYFLKLYPRAKAKWRESDLVHEHIDVSLPTKILPIVIKHYGHDSTEIIATKKNRYSTLKAQQRLAKGRGFSPLRMLVIFPIMFLKLYFLHRFFLCGWRGLIKANIEAGYFFLTEAKLFEHKFKQK